MEQTVKRGEGAAGEFRTRPEAFRGGTRGGATLTWETHSGDWRLSRCCRRSPTEGKETTRGRDRKRNNDNVSGTFDIHNDISTMLNIFCASCSAENSGTVKIFLSCHRNECICSKIYFRS